MIVREILNEMLKYRIVEMLWLYISSVNSSESKLEKIFGLWSITQVRLISHRHI